MPRRSNRLTMNTHGPMNEPSLPPPEIETGDAALADMSPAEVSRLAEAVAGLAKVVPAAPEGLLAPRLRTPLFAGFVILALGAHAAGFGAHLILGGHEGDSGRLGTALGTIVIEAEIIDGQDAADLGGVTDAAMPGNPDPLAMAAIEQAASQPQTRTDSPQPPPPVGALRPEVLAASAPDEVQAAAVLPPPPFQIDTSAPPKMEPAERIVERPVDPVQKAPDPEPTKTDPAITQDASRASATGDGGRAQSTVERPGIGGRAGATPGEVKSYHARLGARLRANRPSSRGKAGFVEIAFAIEPDGRLRFAEVKRSSGSTFLEDRALAAVRKSSPFPKPPPMMIGKQLEFSVPFTFE